MTRLLLHEWCASGGAAALAPPSPEGRAALAAEGLAMLAALVRDAAAAGLDPVVLLDERLPRSAVVPAAAAAVTTIPVPAGGELDALAREAARAHRTIVVAPETDDVLAERVALVRACGGRPVACDERFIALAADKQATVAVLAGRGVPVPAGSVLRPGLPLPTGFRLPAVAKARASCGGEGLTIVERPDDLVPVPLERRIEAHVAGTAVGVSCLCGPSLLLTLPPVRQRFAPDSGGRFVGGDFSLATEVVERATRLAERAVTALSHAGGEPRGWVGVDMILGTREDGSGDRVLEVNPRLTTSFVGLRRWADPSLLRAMLDVADGVRPGAGWMPRPPRDQRGAFDVGAAGEDS